MGHIWQCSGLLALYSGVLYTSGGARWGRVGGHMECQVSNSCMHVWTALSTVSDLPVWPLLFGFWDTSNYARDHPGDTRGPSVVSGLNLGPGQPLPYTMSLDPGICMLEQTAWQQE